MGARSCPEGGLGMGEPDPRLERRALGVALELPEVGVAHRRTSSGYWGLLLT